MQLPTPFSLSPSASSSSSLRASTTAFLLLTLAPPLATCLSSFDCEHVRLKGKSYDFRSLSGPHSVSVIDRDRPPAITNQTWTVDLCKAMGPVDRIPRKEQCPEATRVCGIETSIIDNVTTVEHVIQVAGTNVNEHRHLDAKWKVIPQQEDSSDWTARGGIELALHGGKAGSTAQMAIIEMICDPERTGNEGNEDAPNRGKDSEMDGDGEDEKLRRRETKGEEEGDEDGDEDPMKNSLRFVSYGKEDSDKVEVLRLRWATKLVCRSGVDDDVSSGWGFFTWFILLLFMGTAAYLIFGSWLNYNRYGARGWDLLPHGDTIRDIPYLFRDWSRKVVDTIQGGHSRAGYSAV